MIIKLLSKLPIKYIEEAYFKKYGNEILSADKTQKRIQEVIIADMGKVEGAIDLFKSIAKDDLIRFFNVIPEEQKLVRGAHNRIMWLVNLMQKESKKTNKDKKTNHVLTSPRHG